MSYAARATRFLVERRGLGGDPEYRREISEESEVTPDLSSHLSLISQRPDGDRVGSCPEHSSEISEISEESLPLADNAWLDGVRTAFAPILHLPPAGCLGPRVCSRIGPCDRHAAGRPCRVAESCETEERMMEPGETMSHFPGVPA